MEATYYKDFYHLEAQEFFVKNKSVPLWLILLKATGIFFLITFIVFGITNYQFISAQLNDWRNNGGRIFKNDSDGDGLPDWWEKKYALDIKNSEDASADGDNDGASNLLEYQFGTNPLLADTDGDGYKDGQEIIAGYNPNGEGRLDTDGDGIYDWWEKEHGLDKNNDEDADEDLDNDGLKNREEFRYNSNPINPDTDGDGVKDGLEVSNGTNPNGKGPLQINETTINDIDGDGLDLEHENLFGSNPNNPDTDGDGFNDYREISRGYDPTGGEYIKAIMKIPVIGVEAPVIWSHKTNEKEVLDDLEKGVIHYAGTPIPVMRGNSYITGHSSYYSWSKSSFKDILRHINKLKIGDEIIFSYILNNGKNIDIIYQVTVPGLVVLPNNRKLFEDSEDYKLTLATCWPVGTNLKRMFVQAKLVRPAFKK